jgi:protein O-GlcNAc transferase
MSTVTLDQALRLALEHHQAGRLAEAEAIYRQILAAAPNHADALHLLGLIAHQTGRNDIAGESIRKAIEQNPNCPPYHSNLGEVYRAAGQFDQAVGAFRAAVRLRPDYAEAHSNLGNVLTEQGELDQAIAACRTAIQLKPDYVEAHGNLASAFAAHGELDEAIDALRAAIRLKPDWALGHYNLGIALKDQGQLDEAIDALRTSIRLEPNFAAAHSSLLFTLQFHPRYDARSILQEHQRWNDQLAEPLKRHITPHLNDRSPDRRLKIGYVSPDFRDHVVGRNLLPLFIQHDRRQVEIVCFSNARGGDAITARFRASADGWHETFGLNDEAVADLIRRERIDILVDLSLHMPQNRLLVFARKPAPVQVTFAGYPGTTGLSAMDYRLTDPHLDPDGTDGSYAEKSIRLPQTFWCFDPLTGDPASSDPPVNDLPAHSAGRVTFGCFNNFCKINEGTLKLWSRVLRVVADSRLLLLAPEGSARQRVLDVLRREWIAPERVDFLPKASRPQYLAYQHRIDIALDTLPYNGHTTSLDAFWMGVPVVTLVGDTVVGRAGLSQLMNLNLPELIARTPDEYEWTVVGLANDLPRLADLRRTLRDRMKASPLMDANDFARNIEAAYWQMWQTWCAQR